MLQQWRVARVLLIKLSSCAFIPWPNGKAPLGGGDWPVWHDKRIWSSSCGTKCQPIHCASPGTCMSWAMKLSLTTTKKNSRSRPMGAGSRENRLVHGWTTARLSQWKVTRCPVTTNHLWMLGCGGMVYEVWRPKNTVTNAVPKERHLSQCHLAKNYARIMHDFRTIMHDYA